VFLLVPDHPGSPGQRAVKRSLIVHCCSVSLLAELHMAVKEKMQSLAFMFSKVLQKH